MRTRGPGIWFKLVTGFFLLGFLPLSVMGYFLYESGKADILESARENLLSVAQAESLEVENFAANVLEDTVMFAGLPFTRSLAERMAAPASPREFEKVRAEMDRSLASFIHPDGDVEAYFFLHPVTGEVLSSSDPYQVGKFFNKKPYFKKGIKEAVMYRVHYSPALEKSILAISSPVNGGGRLLGVIVCWANVENIRRAMDLYTDLRSYLVNRANLYVYDSGEWETGPLIRTGVFTEAAEKALQGQSGTGIFNGPDGKDVLGAYTYIDGLDMALVVESSLSDVFENVSAMGRRILLTTALFAAFILVVSIVAGRKIASPLIEMSRAAEEISLGRLDQRIGHSSGDELGLLSDAMNRMAESLAFRERELREVLVTLNALVEHMPEGVVFLNSEDRVILANPLGERLLEKIAGARAGAVLEDIGGKPLGEFLASPLQVMWHEVEVKGPRKAVFELAAKNIGSSDSAQGTVLVLKEVTLEREVAARAQAQERLAAVGQLASGVAHDFNNILTCVIGYSEMLLAEKELSEDMRRQMEAIQQSGRRGAELITQILDFSRKSASEFKVVNLGELVGNFLGFIERIIPENIQVAFSSDEGEHLVWADETKLHQVLANLSVNSRDAMPSGGRLGFGLHRVKAGEVARLSGSRPEAEWVMLQVSDTGDGVHPEALPFIFEPFFTTKGEGKGTGLGLAQVYGIIRQHEGVIDVGSESGKGTMFSLYLPAALERILPAPSETEGEMPAGQGETVLVVEDDAVVLDLLCSELSRLGYRLFSAKGGSEAIRVFDEHRDEIDVVLTDVVMPDLDGIRLSKTLREKKPGIKVIAVSGYPPGESAEELARAGILHWVQKPFNVRKLAEALRMAIGSAGEA